MPTSTSFVLLISIILPKSSSVGIYFSFFVKRAKISLCDFYLFNQSVLHQIVCTFYFFSNMHVNRKSCIYSSSNRRTFPGCMKIVFLVILQLRCIVNRTLPAPLIMFTHIHLFYFETRKRSFCHSSSFFFLFSAQFFFCWVFFSFFKNHVG